LLFAAATLFTFLVNANAASFLLFSVTSFFLTALIDAAAAEVAEAIREERRIPSA